MNCISSITITLGFSNSPILINKLIDDNGMEMSWQLWQFVYSQIFMIQLYRNKPEDFDLVPNGFQKKSKKDNSKEAEQNLMLEEAKKTRAF
jgi:OFA family oxalate/formate antiporter-like MFS transporter